MKYAVTAILVALATPSANAQSPYNRPFIGFQIAPVRGCWYLGHHKYDCVDTVAAFARDSAKKERH